MPNSCKKGKRGEVEAAEKMSAALGIELRRSKQSRGSEEADLEGLKGVHCEVKRVEAFHLWVALQQAKDDCKPGDVPVVLHRKNRTPWVLVVEVDRLVELVDKLNAILLESEL